MDTPITNYKDEKHNSWQRVSTRGRCLRAEALMIGYAVTFGASYRQRPFFIMPKYRFENVIFLFSLSTKLFLDQSIRKIFYLILKIEALAVTPEAHVCFQN